MPRTFLTFQHEEHPGTTMGRAKGSEGLSAHTRAQPRPDLDPGLPTFSLLCSLATHQHRLVPLCLPLA